MRSPTLASPSQGTAGKLERIQQLADYGLNTPRLIRIDAGTRFDDALRARLREAAAGEELMTVRTYHPTDETTFAKGPFAPEIPVEDAVRKAEEVVSDWHVLFQEAIDVNETVLAGNLLLAGDGSGQYEALAGRFRVRDVEHPPPGAEAALRVGTFAEAGEIEEPEIRELVARVARSGLLADVASEPDARIVIEFNVQERPVGRLREPLLLWEWRPFEQRAASASRPRAVRREPRGDGAVYGIGVALQPAPTELDDADRLGGKGLSLARAAAAGLPVPPAFVLSVPPGDVPARAPEEWERALPDALRALGEGRRLVSVRSSPTASMPGMLDTVTHVEPVAASVLAAVGSVLESWRSERAVAYRRNRGLADARLAVVVQAMVDGRAGPASGTGVGFTRRPVDGEPSPVVEYLPRAEGAELVGGLRTPEGLEALERDAPAAAREVLAWPALLERTFRDLQEFEFTVERGRPFLLQSRSAKRSPAARVRVAHDLLAAGIVTAAEARASLRGVDLRRLARSRLETAADGPIATARVAAPGAAVGRVVLDRSALELLRESGDPSILVAETTDPSDYPLLADLAGMVTRLGGVTSHAAVAALEAGIVALVGCSALRIDHDGRTASFVGVRVAEGDWISIEGADEGRVFEGRLPEREPELPAGLTRELLDWARKAQAAEV